MNETERIFHESDISTFFPIDNDNDNGINKKFYNRKEKERNEHNEKF